MEQGSFRRLAGTEIVRGLEGLRSVETEQGCTMKECCFYPFGQWVEGLVAAVAEVGIAAAAGNAAVAAGIVVAVAAAGTADWDSHQHFEEPVPLPAGTDYKTLGSCHLPAAAAAEAVIGKAKNRTENCQMASLKRPKAWCLHAEVG